jgi:hypothetical protein
MWNRLGYMIILWGTSFWTLSWCTVCQIIAVLPATSVDCERGFSNLGRIKSNLRNRLRERLEALMRISTTVMDAVTLIQELPQNWSRDGDRERTEGQVERGSSASNRCLMQYGVREYSRRNCWWLVGNGVRIGEFGLDMYLYECIISLEYLYYMLYEGFGL